MTYIIPVFEFTQALKKLISSGMALRSPEMDVQISRNMHFYNTITIAYPRYNYNRFCNYIPLSKSSK